ncbi:hypothetical protein NSU_4543 [Novosphingobium pentaromativorans US6-1]|uniref:Uncharacterized protein n=1 Tax=Novosphingobium pentaromativorans US6-1 TaxID=1088721 RepID=G6EJM2_9SPHN|nr:hypothetical protein NSU_4543 [Novosphingobium pentaromativorans US6-1]
MSAALTSFSLFLVRGLAINALGATLLSCCSRSIERAQHPPRVFA